MSSYEQYNHQHENKNLIPIPLLVFHVARRLASSPSLEIAKVDISSSTRQGDPFGWRTGKERDLSNTSVLKIDHC